MSIQKQLLPMYGAQLISVGSGFLSTLLLARMLGPAMQGEWALYMQFTQFCNLVFSLGLPPALIYFLASGKLPLAKAQQLIRSICIITAGMLCLFTGVYALSTNRWLLPDSLLHSWTLLFIPLHSTALLWIQFQGAILQANNQFKRFAWIQSASMLLQVCGIAVFYAIPLPPTQALPILLSWYVVLSGVQIMMLRPKQQESQSSVSNATFSFFDLTQYASLAFATNVIQFLNYKIDIWFLRYFHIHSADIGIYTLSVSLSQLVWLLPQALQSIVFRDISHRQDQAVLYQECMQWTRRLAMYMLPVCLLGSWLSQWVVPPLFGMAYLRVPEMISLLLLGIGPFGLIMVMSAYFSGTGRVYVNFVSAVLGFVIGVYADYLWIPGMGIYGAALASIASYCATALFMFIVFFYEKNRFASHNRD